MESFLSYIPFEVKYFKIKKRNGKLLFMCSLVIFLESHRNVFGYSKNPINAMF